MLIVNEMPKTGSFVMVWGDPDNLFGESFKYIDDVLHVWGVSHEYDDGVVYEDWIADHYWEVSSIMTDDDTKFIVK